MEAIRRLRLLELANQSRLQALRAGLASIVPIQLMTVMSPFDMELRTCGLPKVDIEFLKVSITLDNARYTFYCFAPKYNL